MIDIKKIPIYCINLDKRLGRYTFFMRQEGCKELNIRRYPAVDGSLLKIIDNPDISYQTQYNILNKTRRSHGEIDTAGAIGCSLSHYNIWKEFLKTDAQHCLVLEDDAKIPVGLSDTINEVSPLNGGFDVWLLSYRLYDKRVRIVDTTNKKWKTPVYFWGTASYILSRKGAEELIQHFFPIECHLDKYMCLKASLKKTRIVIHEDIQLYTLSHGTDIQLNTCQLCKFPSDFNDGILVKKSILAGTIFYGVLLTILFTMKTR
jgi:GR25 family glycosyltransferase involved in LPS biosynthesis